MSRLTAFGRFWWDFIVGDDWLTAASIVVAIAVTATIARTDTTAWWVMPPAVLLVLYTSLRRATRD